MNVTSPLLLASLEDTQQLAARVAARLRAGDVVTLEGDLGAGKTTFSQFLIQALSPQPVEVTSPTFTLLQTYPVIAANGQECELFHYDLYRIESSSALIELGLDDALNGMVLIEWPERLADYPLPVALALSFTQTAEGVRRVSVTHAAAHLQDGIA